MLYFTNLLKRFLIGIVCCLFSVFKLSAQTNLGDISQALSVNQTSINDLNTQNFVKSLSSANVLSLDKSKIKTLTQSAGSYQIMIPTKKDGVLTINLTPSDVFAKDFRVMTPDGAAEVELPTFYWGTVVGKVKSGVAFTITKEGIEGMLSYDGHSLTIGKIKNIKESLHIIYESGEIPNSKPICEMPPIKGISSVENKSLDSQISLVPTTCRAVRIRMEADYKTFTDFGNNLTNATSYVASLFNQVALLYYNEGVNIKLSEVFVWTSTDPHASQTSTTNVLYSLKSYWNSRSNNFTGDICHLISTRSLGGGIAFSELGSSVYGSMDDRAVFQNCSKTNAYGMSGGLSTTVTNIPTYSWNVEVVTHELGHNFGLPHTHSCSWPGGPIDNCAAVEDGSCTAPAGTGVGTIMSYCHLTNRGIDFNLGFGTHPGAKLRAEVGAASCLTGLVSPDAISLITCSPGSFSLTATGCQGPSGSVSYRWYDAATGGTLLQTGATYTTPTISATTNYYVECTVSAACTSTRITAAITFNNATQPLPAPTVPATSITFCASKSVTLAASGCPSGSNYSWYVDNTTSTAVFTGQQYTTPVLSATTSYYVACTSSGCTSSTRTVATATQSSTSCPYCITFADCADNDMITLVRIQENSTDLLNVASTCATNGYLLTSSPVPNLTINSVYSITVSNPGLFSEGLVVWLDFNKNGQFESPSEIIQTVNNSTWTSRTATFTVPNTAVAGNTRMRAKIAYARNPTDPCVAGTYGETEDYIVNIVGNCPQNLLLVSTTDDMSSGTNTKQANSTNGTITARNKILNANTRATYQAKIIFLDTGFMVNSGTIFKAEVGGCN